MGVGWCHQQVDMVCHEHPRVDGDRVLLGTLSQPVGIGFDVGFFSEADLPIVPTLDDMNGKPWRTVTG